MLRLGSSPRFQDDDFLGHIPVACIPTILYEFDVKIKISSSILQGSHHSDMYEATLTMIATQFALNQKEWKSLAPLIHSILKKTTQIQLNKDWKLDKKQARQIWLYEKRIKVNGHLDCGSLSASVPIYDEFSFNTTCKEESFILAYDAKIFFSPAISTAGILYEQRGFDYYIYKENEFDKELAKKIQDVIYRRKLMGINVDDNGSLDLDDWYSFNKFHYSIRRMGVKYLISLHRDYPVDPFAIDSEEENSETDNSDEIMSVDDNDGYDDPDDYVYNHIYVFNPNFYF